MNLEMYFTNLNLDLQFNFCETLMNVSSNK